MDGRMSEIMYESFHKCEHPLENLEFIDVCADRDHYSYCDERGYLQAIPACKYRIIMRFRCDKCNSDVKKVWWKHV